MKLIEEDYKDISIFDRKCIDNDIIYISEYNKIIGIIHLYSLSPEINYLYIDMLLFKGYRNKGYGTEALTLLINTIIKDNTNELICLTNSKKEENFLLKNGFVENKEYLYDKYYYSKIIQDIKQEAI